MAEQNVATSVGKVILTEGNVYIKEVTGELIPLIEDMNVYAGQLVQTGPQGSILVELSNGEVLSLGRNTLVRLDEDLIGSTDIEENQTTSEDIQKAIEAVQEGNFDALEATAAGEQSDVSSAAQSANFIPSPLSEGEVTSGYDTGTFNTSRQTPNERVFDTTPIDPVNPQNDNPPVTTISGETRLMLDNVSVNEGSGTATISGTLDNAPTDAPLVITLDNGATMTFAVGATSATSTPFSVQGDDVYKDGETITVNATVESGGTEFENLVTTDTATVTITDTTDDTTVSLSATSSITEAGADVVYTATLTNASEGVTTVTLSNGETISIADGATSGTATVTVAADEDVYLDEDTISAKIETATGGNFENIVIDSTPATTKITDTTDDTTVSLSATSSITEAGADVV
ncbi:retention module-containing protein, partial [Hydrogenovibrio sp. 3SP14C1]|uniref:retention module-containing protein n=1 Tax=Hydrogenovibrio sp. 3SP14C1 TaxID=3038774 RepID=UPI002417A643